MDLNEIISYLNHYGARSLFHTFGEKMILDKRRFSADHGEPSSFPEAQAPRAPLGIGAGKRNILYLTHYFYPDKRGGTERFVFNMAKMSKLMGRSPLVLVLDFNLPKNAYTREHGGILYREFEYSGIRCIGFRHKKAPLGLYYKRIAEHDDDMRAFARLIFENEGIDFIHAAYPQPFAPLLFEAVEMGIPYIATLTDFAMLCHYASMVNKDGRFCDGADCGKKCTDSCPAKMAGDTVKRYENANKCLQKALGIYVPSEFSRRVYASEFKSLPVTVIPHGINEDFAFKRRRGKPRRLLYVGGDARHKGLELLISAFSELGNDDVTLTLLGVERDYNKRDKRIITRSAVPPECMPALYRTADAVIVPSLSYESYNFVAREAISCGALAVLADIGAVGESVKNGGGILFKAGDRASLVSALHAALKFDLALIKEQRMPTLVDEWNMYYGDSI